jgi:ABC-type multidrug transport system fused ATPase/permease subunit
MSSFAYPESDHQILKDINFKINAGVKNCFCWSNGAGKPLLTKLLMVLRTNFRRNVRRNLHYKTNTIKANTKNISWRKLFRISFK